jgi:integrase
MAVRKTKAGTFEVDIRDQHGKKRLKTFKLEREAKAYEHEALAKIGKGEYVAPGRKTVGEAASDWLEKKQAQNYRRASLIIWKNHVENYIMSSLGNVKLSDLDEAVIETALAEWGKRVQPQTANQACVTLSTILDMALRHKLVVRNAAANAERLKVATEDDGEEVAPDKVYDKAELLRLIQASDGMARVLVMLLAFTGLRVGEALALSWDQVDLKAARLDVKFTLADADEGKPLVFQEPKNRSSKRTLSLPAQLVKELTSWKIRCPISERRLVFAREDGFPCRRTKIGRLFDRVIKKAGVKRLTPHGLRHTFASQLLANGVPVTEVSHLLGHKNPQVTMRTYAHFIPKVSTAAQDLAALVMGE